MADDVDVEAHRLLTEWQTEMAARGSIFILFADSWLKDSQSINVVEDSGIPLLIKAGMPANAQYAMQIFQGARWGFRNYRVEMLGTIAYVRPGSCKDAEDDITPMETGAFARFDMYKEPSHFGMHLWRTRVYLRNVSGFIEEFWHASAQRYIRWVYNIPSHHGKDISQDIDDLTRLAKGMRLINLSKQIGERQRRLKLSKEQFLEQGLKAAEMAAKAGVDSFGFQQLVPFFKKLGRIKDRETIKRHADTYSDEWEKITKKFDDTWEWLRGQNMKV